VLVGFGVAFVLATSRLLLTAPGQLPSYFDGSGEITEWTLRGATGGRDANARRLTAMTVEMQRGWAGHTALF
jgi:hypothetical protein